MTNNSQQEFIQLTKTYYQIIMKDINIVNKAYINSLGYPKTNIPQFKLLTSHYKLIDDVLNSLQLINTKAISSKKQLELLNKLTSRYFNNLDTFSTKTTYLITNKNTLCQEAYNVLDAISSKNKELDLIQQTYETKMSIIKEFG